MSVTWSQDVLGGGPPAATAANDTPHRYTKGLTRITGAHFLGCQYLTCWPVGCLYPL